MTNFHNLNLKVKKRIIPAWLTSYLFIFPFILSFLLEFAGLPSIIKYTADLVWVILFAVLFVRKYFYVPRNIMPYIIFIVIFIVYTGIVYIFNFQSIFYYLWGLRNNFRFYVAFLAFAVFFDEEDASTCLNIADILFWINVPITFIQFFIWGYQQDNLGGIFGVERGCNAYLSIFFAIIISKSLLLFMDGKEKTLSCFLKCAFSLIIAAMAELKFFFIIFVLILIMASFMTKFSWKKVFILILLGAIIMFSGQILTIIFGENEQLTMERIMELITSSSYATTEDLGRITAIPTISKSILTDTVSQLFGMGLGNCDTSAFAICNTPFYQAYEHLHYSWFSSAFLFLETGYIGLLLNLSFFVICFVYSWRLRKNGKGNVLFFQLTMIVSVLCVLLTFYNSALRKETAYIAFFALSLAAIAAKSANQN